MATTRTPQTLVRETHHADGLIWNGFEYEWKNHPHRLSILGSR